MILAKTSGRKPPICVVLLPYGELTVIVLSSHDTEYDPWTVMSVLISVQLAIVPPQPVFRSVNTIARRRPGASGPAVGGFLHHSRATTLHPVAHP